MQRALAFIVAAAACAAAPAQGLVGKPLPELALSHPLQGEAWNQADLRGAVVVLDVFQLG